MLNLKEQKKTGMFDNLTLSSFLSQGGPADSTLSVGHGSKPLGIFELTRKGLDKLDFETELNFEKNIKDRDVEDIPNYHFRDDGLKLWHVINGYVQEIINIFYETDKEVEEDKELQDWDFEVNE